jgi:hypothetical protein
MHLPLKSEVEQIVLVVGTLHSLRERPLSDNFQPTRVVLGIFHARGLAEKFQESVIRTGAYASVELAHGTLLVDSASYNFLKSTASLSSDRTVDHTVHRASTVDRAGRVMGPDKLEELDEAPQTMNFNQVNRFISGNEDIN